MIQRSLFHVALVTKLWSPWQDVRSGDSNGVVRIFARLPWVLKHVFNYAERLLPTRNVLLTLTASTLCQWVHTQFSPVSGGLLTSVRLTAISLPVCETACQPSTCTELVIEEQQMHTKVYSSWHQHLSSLESKLHTRCYHYKVKPHFWRNCRPQLNKMSTALMSTTSNDSSLTEESQHGCAQISKTLYY